MTYFIRGNRFQCAIVIRDSTFISMISQILIGKISKLAGSFFGLALALEMGVVLNSSSNQRFNSR